MTRRACIISIGNEVVHGFIVNTNATWLARELSDLGFDVMYHLSLTDREDELVQRLSTALNEGLFIVTTGGIGPTVDDRTRATAAKALGVPLAMDHDALAKLQDRYAAMARKFPAGSECQAQRPAGSTLIPNAFGTASCFYMKGRLAALPGVPREMKGVWAEELRKAIIEDFGLTQRWFSRELRVFGLPESDLNNRVRPLLESKDAEGAILVDDAVLRLRWRVLADDPAAADKILQPILDAALSELGDLVFAEGDVSLEETTVKLLIERRLTLACAESCTGGMIAHLLTNVPGSGEVLIESAVTYTEDAKHRRLGVKKTTLKKYTAVSQQTAEEMVRGIVKESAADIGVAVTGIAGPPAPTDEAPVGTVWLAASFKGEVKAWHLRVPGDREQVKWRTARTAINTARLIALHGKLPDEIAPWLTPPG